MTDSAPSATERLRDVPAPAKLNLFLHVTGRRADGYHLLQSVFMLIDWCDTLHFERRADGEIRRVEYTDYDVKAGGIPAHRKDYEFTSGTLSSQGKDVEFGVHVHPVTGEYSVTADELQEIKTRAAALFAGAARQE